MSELRRSEGRNGRTGRPSRAILALLIVTLAGVAACSGTQHSKTSGATPGNLAATAGFSSPTTASSDPANVPGVVGYLFADPASVTFLQWRADSTGNLQGTENSASATGTPPDASVRTGTTSFSGRTNGTSVTLDVGLHTDQGVLSGTNLTLNVIQTDGSIRPIAYRQATPSDYNQALAALNATVQHADAQARNANNQAQAISTLASDYQGLGQQKSSIKDDLSSLSTDLETASNDLRSCC